MDAISEPIQEHDERRGIRVYYVRVGKDDEPALWVQRNAFSFSGAYVLPLNQAYLLADDRDRMEKAFICAKQLDLDMDKATIHYLMDLLVKHVDGLLAKIPPAPVKKKIDFENEMDAMGITGFKVNGEAVI